MGVKEIILNEQQRTVNVSRKDLIMDFGFQRLDGLTASARRMFNNQSELTASTLPMSQMIENVSQWCKENGLVFSYDHMTDSFNFHRLHNPTPA